jgi:hypothetical protein
MVLELGKNDLVMGIVLHIWNFASKIRHFYFHILE